MSMDNNMAGDTAFLSAMIAHHEAALKMSRSYLAKSNPANRLAAVSALARSIVSAQESEISEMRDLLKVAKSRAGGGR